VIKKNPNYNFVFIEKYFPDLKYLFIKPRIQQEAKTDKLDVDLSLDPNLGPLEIFEFNEIEQDLLNHEAILSKLIKIQDFNSGTLLDFAVNFIQSDFNKTAIESIQLVLKNENDKKIKLKAYYLLTTAYLKLGDFRAALDVCLTAMEMAESQNDILSFLYGQAEAYLKLKDRARAKGILERIIAIDRNYRLAKEKLERLNAV
jgi:tetratricopeptide (TPR) repeat protein